MSNFIVDMDNIDKTGFNLVKHRALFKSLWYKTDNNEVTIGPNATGWEDTINETTTSEEPPRVPRKPEPKLNARRSLKLDVEENDKTDIMCNSKIIAVLDDLAKHEAQEAKNLFIRKMEEHKRKFLRENLDALIAQEESKWLKIEQQRLEQLSTELLKTKQVILNNEKLKSTKDESLENVETSSNTTSLTQKEQKSDFKDEEKIQNNARYEALFKNREKFMELYNSFLQTISHEQLNLYRQSELPTARKTNDLFVSLLTKCKEGKVSKEDLENSETLLKSMEHSCRRAITELEKQKELRQKEIENEKKERQLKEQKEREKENMISDQESSGYTELYEKANKYLKEVESTLESFLVDPSLKEFRINCQRAITTPVNAISATNAKHLIDKLDRIVPLLEGKDVKVVSKTVNSQEHPLGILYCKYFLAQKVVNQGEFVVSSHPETAFALASFVLAMWSLFPDFGLLLMARFYRTCPYLIPKYWEAEPNESEQDYNRRIGFLYDNNGEKEDIEKFLKRQGGVVKLYAALIISPMKRSFQHLPHPLSVAEAWRWTAAFSQLKPRAFISATLLLDMLEVTSYALNSAYRNQFRKLLHFICKFYVPEIEKVTPDGHKGPVTRLTSFLENIVNGKSVPPKGVLSADFW